MTRRTNSRAKAVQIRDYLNELEARERITNYGLGDHLADPNPHDLRSYRSSAINTTIVLDDRMVEAAAPDLTFTLLSAVGITGYEYILKNFSSGALTVDGDGTELIDGGLTAVLTTPYESITVISNGTGWSVV